MLINRLHDNAIFEFRNQYMCIDVEPGQGAPCGGMSPHGGSGACIRASGPLPQRAGVAALGRTDGHPLEAFARECGKEAFSRACRQQAASSRLASLGSFSDDAVTSCTKHLNFVGPASGRTPTFRR